MSELTAEVLSHLYWDEGLAETLIAQRFGVSQVQVNRLRRKWGIPTRTRTDRVSGALPELTAQQRELIIGSLLGDGWMSATSAEAARFAEGHCEKQAEYVDWKADLMDPFTSTRRWGEKRAGVKVFKNRSFTTASCRQLRPFYDLFYPAPDHQRVFPANLHELITPFALAVWYMDDGSIGVGSHGGHNARISFGLDDLSLKRALRALRALGLNASVYGEGGSRGIWFLGQVKKFRDLIEPYVPACMRYKLPTESPRQVADRNARRLTPEKAVSHAQSGLSDAVVAQMYGLSVGTVRRRLRDGGLHNRKRGPKGSSLSIEAATSLLTEKYPVTVAWEGQDDWIEDVLAILRRIPFPYPELPSQENRNKQFARLRAMSSELTLSTMGLSLCYPFFPNRYQARYQGKMSAYEAWHTDPTLRSAIKWQFKVGDPVTPKRVLRAVCANVRTPSVFRPAVAAALYRRYCPRGGVVWDPCAGFGGRLLGACAAGVGKYIATDVAPETVGGNLQLAEWLGCQSAVEVVEADATAFRPSTLVDMVFTSPPYFQQEQYVGGNQSWQEHPTYEGWVAGFLAPLVQRGVEALKPGGYWVMNIADVRSRDAEMLPLESAARSLLSGAGLIEVDTLTMPLPKLNRSRGGEPVLVWRKCQ